MGNAKIIPVNRTPGSFLPFQAAWIRDNSRLKLMEKSRQIGVSWTAAAGIVRRKGRADAKLDAWISSRDDIQAQLFMRDCAAFAEIYELAAQDLGAQFLDPEKKITSYVLQFANGCRINSMSSSPDAQAGKRGDRLLDEFALHKDPRKLYSIAYPGITWGGQLEIVSTHRGSANFFNELVREVREKGNPKRVSLHRVTLQDALDQGFLYKLQEKLAPEDERQEMDEAAYFAFIRSGCADEESFLQEYMCVPADDNSAFLTYDLIASCEYGEGVEWRQPLDAITNPLYVGVDIGREHDLTVIAIAEKAGGRYCLREMIELKQTTFTRQVEILYEVLARRNVVRCCIDATGLGTQMAEQAAERFGSWRVGGIKFTAPAKEQLAYPLKAAFEDRNILIPMDRNLRADLRSIKKIVGAGNVDRFAADHGPNGHADRFWALALVIEAGKTAGGSPGVEPLVTGRRTDPNAGWKYPDHSDDR
ncbi:MAG: terminase family protein [Victivallaceae bacterium]|nr:terminase family protein [Victivallaceae bacterium]